MLSVAGIPGGSAPIFGAAATIRVIYPTRDIALVSSDDTYHAGKGDWQRQGSAALEGFAAISTGTVTGAVQYKGALCVSLNSTAAGNGAALRINLGPYYRTEREAAPLTNDTACWSFRYLLAYDNPAGPLGKWDCGIGFQSGQGTGSGVWNSTTGNALAQRAGIGFYVTDAQTLSVRARRLNASGDALSIDDVVPLAAGFDITEWHSYDWQIITGMTGADPYIQGFIDGIPATKQYPLTAADGRVPNCFTGDGAAAFAPFLTNNSNAVLPKIYFRQLVITAARNQADLF